MYEKLKKEFSHKLFPTLPDKTYFGRFEQDTIEKRMGGLQDFLKFCIADPDIKIHKEFQLFIQK